MEILFVMYDIALLQEKPMNIPRVPPTDPITPIAS